MQLRLHTNAPGSAKSFEEIAISAELRSCRKDKERTALLKEQRATLEAERKVRKDAAKSPTKLWSRA